MLPSLITPQERINLVPVKCTAHSGRFAWRRLRAEDYPDLPPSDIRCAGMNAHLLVYHYKALDGVFHHECAGRITETRLQTGQLSFVPAGADNRWLFGEGRPGALHIMIDEAFFEESVARDRKPGSGGALRDDFQVTSPELQALVRLLGMELASGGLNGALYAEALAAALAHRMAREFGAHDFGRERPDVRPNLKPAVDRLHDEYFRGIGLDELAKMANLSRAQFVRQFRKAFGKAPHAYLIEYRIAIAKRQLQSCQFVSLSCLAQDLGFADQSHFHRHFRMLTGLSPAAFRREFQKTERH